MVHHINSFTLVELSFDVEECFVEGLALANFIDEPEVFLVLYII